MGRHKFVRPIETCASVADILPGLQKSTKRHYLANIERFCVFCDKNPDKILAERKRDLKSDDLKVQRRYERRAIEFYEKRKTQGSETNAFSGLTAIRSFFSRNYLGLKFRKKELASPREETHEYIPTLGEIREIVNAAPIRDKAVILTMLQTGLAPADLSELQRAPFDTAIKRADEQGYPVSVGWVAREKTGKKSYLFLFHDAGEALKRYLRSRSDTSPWLFLERRGKRLTPRGINDLFVGAAKKAITIPNELRLRCYSLRKIFSTQLQNSRFPQTWLDLLMGHQLAGSRGAYSLPSERELLARVKEAEPYISISETIATDQRVKGLVDERTSELAGVVEGLGKQVKRLEKARSAQAPDAEIMDKLLSDPAVRRVIRRRLVELGLMR